MASFGASNTSSSNEYYISPTQWNTTTTYTNFDMFGGNNQGLNTNNSASPF